MSNEDLTTTIEDRNGRFYFTKFNEEYGPYSRRRDAVRGAERRGYTVAV